MLDSITLKEAIAIAGPLGFPSKMPGTSYGISAKSCGVGAKLAQIEGSVCHGCYALKGNYLYPSVAKAHEKRLAGISHPAWAIAVAKQITVAHTTGQGRTGPIATGHHRWHDSGDLQDESHLAKICVVATLTPDVEHWLPTRELQIVKSYVANGGIVPPNLLIRVSATMVDGQATKAWPTTSTVHSTWNHYSPLCDHAPTPNAPYRCPAPEQDGRCGPCRACWSHAVPQTTYHKH
jgi:hypothetical protein